MRKLVTLVLTVFMLPATADQTFQFHVDEDALPFVAADGVSTLRHWGVHEHAGYRMEVPEEDWSGVLVLYAHGFRGNDVAELTVTNPPLRTHLLDQGHAWAASSFSRNRYDVATGVRDSLALLDLFREEIGTPDRIIIMGHDLGGHVAAVSAELFPDSYDGALPLCAPLGDTELVDYLLGFNLAAQALTGMEARFPDHDFQQRTRPLVMARLGESWPEQRTAAGDQLRQVLLHLSGGSRPLFDEALAAWGDRLFDFGHLDGHVGGVAGGNVADTQETVFRMTDTAELTSEEKQLNEDILRIQREPLTLRGARLDHIPAITGEIRIPVLTLHTLGDLFVPIAMQQAYAERVSANGDPDLLVQRAVRDIGHCTFSPDEEARAFDDLLRWIEQEEKPGGDAVHDPDALDRDDFGCAFTSPERPNLPACAMEQARTPR